MYTKCNCSRLCKQVAVGGRAQFKEERPPDVGRTMNHVTIGNQVITGDTGKYDA